MTVNDALKEKNIIVAGDTGNPEKYAYHIKKALLENGYHVYEVNKSNPEISKVPEGFHILDLVVNPKRGLELLSSCTFVLSGVVIQPGAGSDEIRSYLEKKGIPYVDGCVLKALSES